MDIEKKNNTGVCEKIFKVMGVGPAIQKIRGISSCPRGRGSTPTRSTPHVGSKTIEIHGEDDDCAAHDHQPSTSKKTQLLIQTPLDHQIKKEDGGLVSSKEKPKATKTTPKMGHKAETPYTDKKGVVSFSKGEEQNSTTKSNASSDHGPDHQSLLQGMNTNNSASDTNVQGKKHGVDHLNEEFSKYIDRTRIQIRNNSEEGKSLWGFDGVLHHDHGNKKDGLKEHFSDYIHRTKVRMIRSSSSFGTAKKHIFKKE